MERLREMEGRTHEDPLREVAALQYLSREGHPNILACTEVSLHFLSASMKDIHAARWLT